MAEGLASPRASAVIDNRGGAGVVTSGPLHETEQYVSGFWIIEAADRDATLALADGRQPRRRAATVLRRLEG